jgi:IPT/TIG domain-containing protein
VAVGALAVAAGAPAPAFARETVLYDLAPSLAPVIAAVPDAGHLEPAYDNLFQQGNATPVLGPGRLAAKVASGPGSLLTPSVDGLDAASLVAVLIQQVQASDAHLVFLDELGPTFRGAGGAALESAMLQLAATPSPYGPGTMAQRVHIYARTIRALLADPAGWASAWHAMALAGGVWLEAYTGSDLPVLPWEPERWLAWPRAFAAELARQGGDLTRLHVLLSSGALGDQPTQWQYARTGVDAQSACALLQNGPGAYRLSSVPLSVEGFAVEFRRTFPAPGGTPVGCSPSPLLAPPVAAALAGAGPPPGALALEHVGAVLPPGALSATQVQAGQTTSVTLTLPGGVDPFGVAGRLAAAGAPGITDPRLFWGAANLRVTANGPGFTIGAQLVQGLDGSWSATLPLTPTGPGPITLALGIDGAAIRAALGPPADLALSLAPQLQQDPGLAPTLTELILDPTTWRLSVPLGTAANPLAPALQAFLPAPIVTAISPASVQAGSGPITLTVTGSGFQAGATVLVSGQPRPTAMVDASTVTAVLSPLDTATAGTSAVRVQAGPTGGGASSALALAIAPMPPPAPQAPPQAVPGPPPARAVSCVVGTWSPAPSAYAYRWLRGGIPIDGATGPSYRPTAADAGRTISCEVTATGAAGRGVARSAPIRLPVAVGPDVGGAALPAAALVGPSRARAAALRVALRLEGPVAGLAVRLQRPRGGGVWSTVLARRVSQRSVVFRPRLAPGRQTLRILYGPAGRTRATAPISVTVLR